MVIATLLITNNNMKHGMMILLQTKMLRPCLHRRKTDQEPGTRLRGFCWSMEESDGNADAFASPEMPETSCFHMDHMGNLPWNARLIFREIIYSNVGFSIAMFES